ncbi:hypothetical protein CHS0354_028815 [Potamilus streckersoni]|uniref:G2 M phase-specific E3 ubiquitin- ligase-like n=1 Tax=Potamilus streckersoni TaxID=2493646 RepID=A0AAE0RYB1_9BIVA|nr:hypothetical protein CHS0354_028815 [Potamilus streckersoni]
MGRVVSRAILSGHPGPNCLKSHIVQYILTGEEPNCNEMPIEQLQKEDIVTAVKEIDAVTEENLCDMLARHVDLLESVGFRKVLSMQNKDEAIMAIKSHYFFYRCLPAILQFMDGLQLLGILNILKTFPVESSLYLKCSMFPTAGDVIDFYVPEYSQNEKEKEIEEILVYNFHQLLRDVERGNIRSTWMNLDDGREEDVQINMGHLLQSLVGSTPLPVNIASGIIEFNHTIKKLTTVNTCAPSITFYSTVENQEYEKFVESFINIIVASYGFGMT